MLYRAGLMLMGGLSSSWRGTVNSTKPTASVCHVYSHAYAHVHAHAFTDAYCTPLQ